MQREGDGTVARADLQVPPIWIRPFLGVAIAVGLALRYWIYSTPLGQLDSDEAVWGLMSRHLLQGEFSPFFWGQPQGGTLEVILSAPFHWVLGQSQLTVELVPFLLTIVSTILVWRIGLRVLDPTGALVAAALFWIWPSYVLWKSTKAHGFYGAGLVLCLLAILFALRLREDPSWTNAALFGLILGLGWWTTAQVVVVFIPLLLWLVIAAPDVLRGIIFIVPAFVCGAAPWFVYNLQHDWISITSEAASPGQNYLSNVEGAFRVGYPGILGLRAPWTQQWLFTSWIGLAMYAVLIVGFVYLIVRAAKEETSNPGVLLLGAIVVMHPFIFAMSNQGYYNGEPRYFYLVAPVLALLLVHAVRRWSLPIACMCLGFALMSSGAGLAFMNEHRVAAQQVPNVPMPLDFAPLLETLEEHDVEHVYANYWLAYPITYLSENRIVASPYGAFNRNPQYAAEVAADPAAAQVHVEGSAEAPTYTEPLVASGIPYDRIEVAGFVIYIPHPPS